MSSRFAGLLPFLAATALAQQVKPVAQPAQVGQLHEAPPLHAIPCDNKQCLGMLSENPVRSKQEG